MNTPSTESHSAATSSDSQSVGGPPVARNSRKRELIYAASGLGTGLIVLPALIYIVGVLLLGPYAGGQSLGAFYGAFYGNLAHGVARTWFVALSPYLAICVVRLSFKRGLLGGRKGPGAAEQQEADLPAAIPQVETKGARREPFISA